MTLWNPFLILVLFVYQFLWGIFLFKFVQSIVVPVMHRFPEGDMPNQLNVFFMETQFRLLKTNLADPYLYVLVLVLGMRMLLTPLINAGLFHNIHQTSTDGKRSFLTGIRKWSIPFSIVYLLRICAVLLPIIWIYPAISAAVTSSDPWKSSMIGIAPLIAGYVMYAGILKLIAMYVQFGIVSGRGVLPSASIVLRHIASAAALSICVLAISFTAAALGVLVSMVFAGIVAIILHQVYQLIKSLFRLWEIGAQHDHWASRSG